MQMPKIELETLKQELAADEFELVKGIVSTRGKNKGCLRASKPKVERHLERTEQVVTEYGTYNREIYEPNEKQGKTAYIWRMVAFSISPQRQHQCMPCTADFDLPGKWSEKKDLLSELDRIVDIVVKSVPITEWHGVKRWGQALGQIGTAQVASDGSIVYR